MIRATFTLLPKPHPSRSLALEAIRNMPDHMIVTIAEPNRNNSQNAAQWPLLHAISQQVEWQINGATCHLSPDDWKIILTASFLKEAMRIAPGVDGGMVLLGAKTSKFSVKRFSEWLKYLHVICATKNVKLPIQIEQELEIA